MNAAASSAFLDQLASRLRDAIASSPARDVQRNVRELVSNALAGLDLVSRQEYEVQVELLARAQQRLEALEARVAELERARGAPAPMPIEPTLG